MRARMAREVSRVELNRGLGAPGLAIVVDCPSRTRRTEGDASKWRHQGVLNSRWSATGTEAMARGVLEAELSSSIVRDCYLMQSLRAVTIASVLLHHTARRGQRSLRSISQHSPFIAHRSSLARDSTQLCPFATCGLASKNKMAMDSSGKLVGRRGERYYCNCDTGYSDRTYPCPRRSKDRRAPRNQPVDQSVVVRDATYEVDTGQ